MVENKQNNPDQLNGVATEECYFTPDEMASRLVCSSRTIRKHCQAGTIKSVRIGSLIRIPASALKSLEGGAQ